MDALVEQRDKLAKQLEQAQEMHAKGTQQMKQLEGQVAFLAGAVGALNDAIKAREIAPPPNRAERRRMKVVE